jgi:hypothetical protein
MLLAGDRKRGLYERLIAVTAIVFGIFGCAEAGQTGGPLSVAPPAGGAGANGVTGGVGGPSGTGQAGTGSGGMGAVPPTGTPLPCNVERIVRDNCGGCHGTSLLFGAPIQLVTHEDFTRSYTAQTTTSAKGQTLKVYELSRMRINATSSPMPPGGALAAADHSVLDAWLAGGATARTAGEICDPGSGMAGTGGGGMGGNTGKNENLCDAADALEPLVPRDGETCYEFPVHGGQMLPDSTKYPIPPGEHYEQFYYDIPWAQPVQGTRFGARYDRVDMQHHWLLLQLAGLSPSGTHVPSPATLIGEGGSKLLAGWSVGGCNVAFPPEVGLELPMTGKIGVQWHFYNSTSATVQDGSSVLVCTVPAGTRPNTASMTWLGTEDLDIPPGMHEYSGTCPNDSNAPITIWGFWPHMHKLGVRMQSTVNRMGGTKDPLFDKPFDFNHQVTYELSPPIVLMPGDTITSTCTFMNDTAGSVDFGESTGDEMCYQFTYSYPARALDNGALSLIGADNTCW